MKKANSPGTLLFKALACVVFLVGAMTMLTPASASAAGTSAGATIWNVVDVQWSTGTATYHNQATAGIAVAVLAATPTLTALPTNRTVLAGAFVTYSTAVQSNSNGQDTYTITQTAEGLTNIAAAGYTVPAPGSIALWGGTITRADVTLDGVIRLPGGSPTPAVGSYVNITGRGLYLVSATTPGNAASGATSAAAPSTLEVEATVTLAPATRWGYSGSTAIVHADATLVGVQTGQVNAADTLSFTAGSPTSSSVGDGIYATTCTFTSTATTLAGAKLLQTTVFTTRVSMPNVTISKWFRTITGGSPGTITTTISPASNPPAAGFFQTGSGTAPKPGEYVEYCLIIHNNHSSVASSNNTVVDPVPAYTTYHANTTDSVLNVGNAAQTLSPVADNSGVSVVAQAGGYNTGILSPSNYSIIVYQVQVK